MVLEDTHAPAEAAVLPLGSLTRRSLLAGTAGAAALLALPAWARGSSSLTGRDVGMGLVIKPREAWGHDLPPLGDLRPERVRFLLVHHSAGSNEYRRDEVREILRGIFGYHTEGKGWPDIAYNFVVDRYGRVWEGRAGSLKGPVRGSATGGNQGFDQKCCFLGHHGKQAPSPAALRAMVRLLTWLCVRYDVDPRRAARVSFVSRGSNRWPKGQEVRTRTIAGHRAMSLTACPGDAVVDLLDSEIPRRVRARMGS